MYIIKILLFCFLFVVLNVSGVAEEGENNFQLSINPSVTFQKMHSFGASDAWRCQFIGKNWPARKKEQIAEWLFSREFDNDGNPKGIGLSLWRFYLGAGSMEQGDSSGITNYWRRAECFQNPDGTYDWNKQEGQQWFLSEARKYGVEYTLAFTISPPVFYTLNGKAHGPNGVKKMNIQPGKMENYAGFLADVVQHFEDEGNGFDFISPFNEPQWDWDKSNQEGTPATNAELFELTSLLAGELAKRNLSTQIAFGECGEIDYLYKEIEGNENRSNQVEVFFDESSPYYVGTFPKLRNMISGHSYFTTWPLSRQIETRKKLAEKMEQFDPELEYWQSEFCILEKNDETQQGNIRDLGMNTALYVARVIHSDITLANATSWQWWTAVTQCDYKDGLVFIDKDGTPGHPNSVDLQFDGDIHDSKLMWALGNFSRFVRPGMKRIEVGLKPALSLQKQAEQLMVSAYTDGKQVVCVVVNPLGEEKVLHPSFESVTTESVTAYITDESRNLEKESDGSDKWKIPPRAVVTVVIDIK